MIIYKQTTNEQGQVRNDQVKRLSDNAFIPFDPANVDFANFKKEILANEAQLQDAEGVIMADAKAYVKELP